MIPHFNWQEMVIEPWTVNASIYGWILAMGILCGTACGWIGNYLLLRRMALVGDAISHSILPGLVLAFIISGSRNVGVMFAGALAAGMVTVGLIELIHRTTRVKPDAAICISFTTLFAAGVVMTSMIDQGGVHIDAECVLYGEIAYVPLEPPVQWLGMALGPAPVLRMACVAVGVLVLITLFYKELLVSSFDPGLTRSMGFSTNLLHYGLMAVLSIVVVSAFEAVGAVLVVALLIIPSMTASQLTPSLPVRHLLVVMHSVLSSLLGLHLAIWMNCSIAAAMILAGAGLFLLAWLGSWILQKRALRRSIREGPLQHSPA